jgi:cell division protein FtsB
VKWLIAGLILFLVFLQYRLWFGDGGLEEISRLQARVEEQRVINRHLQERNTQLEVEVLELQEGLEGVEERARSQLGMVKEGEVFYQLLEEEPPLTTGNNAETIDPPSH